MTMNLKSTLCKVFRSESIKRFSSTSRLSNTDKRIIPLTQKKMTVLDVDINYVETESSGSHVLLCLPGAFSSIELDFQPLIRQLDKSKFKVVAWDPPGYGRSRPPLIRQFTPAVLEKDALYITELMSKLGHPKFSILSWSAGTFSALKTAVLNPSSVGKIVMWGAFGYSDKFTNDTLKSTEAFRILNIITNCGPRWAATKESAIVRTATTQSFELWLNELETAGLASLQEQRRNDLLDLYGEERLKEMWMDWTGSGDVFREAGFTQDGQFTKDTLNKIKCPSLVVHGLKDGFVSVEQAEYLHKNIPNSRLHLMPTGNHNLHVTCVEEFTKIAQAFLEAED